MKSYFGSHLYGTSTPESDVDFKEIFVPPARDILIGNVKEHMSKNTNNTSSKTLKMILTMNYTVLNISLN
ncbi:hypothetical protein ACOIZZ_001972 [Escherichia coli]